MKKCPYCAEEIKNEAIKCKYCGEWLKIVSENIKNSEKVEHNETIKPENKDATRKIGFMTFADPGGRLGRMDFVLYELIFIPVLLLIRVILEHYATYNNPNSNTIVDIAIVIVSFLVGLLFIYFALSGHIRRLHDFDKSGFWILMALVPLLNIVLMLALLFAKGTAGANKYGSENNMGDFFKRVFNLN